MPSWETNCIEDWEEKVNAIVAETVPERHDTDWRNTFLGSDVFRKNKKPNQTRCWRLCSKTFRSSFTEE